MDGTPETSGWQQLYTLQQEYENICRKAWSLRAESDTRERAELDRQVSVVMQRVEEVLRREAVPGLYR